MPAYITNSARPNTTIYTPNFNEADLKTNREGRLSDAQTKRLNAELDNIRSLSRSVFWGWVFLFTVFTIAVVINSYTYYGKDLATIFSRMASPIFIGMLSFLVLALVCTVLEYWWTTHRLVNAPIRAVEGTAQVIGREYMGRDVWVYTVVIQRKWYSRFRFKFTTPEALSHFQNGHRYRVYYLPYKGQHALSAEEIEPDNTSA